MGGQAELHGPHAGRAYAALALLLRLGTQVTPLMSQWGQGGKRKDS